MTKHMVKFRAGLLGTGLIAALVAAGPAHALTVDGSITDWVVAVGDNNTSNFTTVLPPYAGPTGTVGLFSSAVEDQNDNAGLGGYLGPNYGGQAYDVEYMAVAVQTPLSGSLADSTIYIAVSSGLRPDNGFSNFGPGDFYIQAAGKVFGIEAGGGAGHTGGPDSAAQTAGDAGSTYALASNGHTTGHSENSGALADQTVGSIWEGGDWIMDPISPATPVQLKTDISGTKVGDVDSFVYTADTLTDQHSYIELAMSAAPFIDTDGNLVFSVHWGPGCGNDVLEVALAIVPERIEVPEPSSMGVLGLGLTALMGGAGLRRRRARV